VHYQPTRASSVNFAATALPYDDQTPRGAPSILKQIISNRAFYVQSVVNESFSLENERPSLTAAYVEDHETPLRHREKHFWHWHVRPRATNKKKRGTRPRFPDVVSSED
jgi:hypothetical protein